MIWKYSSICISSQLMSIAFQLNKLISFKTKYIAKKFML